MPLRFSSVAPLLPLFVALAAGCSGARDTLTPTGPAEMTPDPPASPAPASPTMPTVNPTGPEPALPATLSAYSDASAPLPPFFLNGGPGGSVIATDNTPANNRTTDAGATLGRVLFYDQRLSANDAVSCASCHQQQFAFGDTARLSRGFRGGTTRRHAMAVVNARFYQRGRFFWDERAASLEAQVVAPIQDTTEMGMILPALETKLAATRFYGALFQAAFGAPDITAGRAARALAQFVRNGLDAVTVDTGAGRGRFKAPSLRNIAVRPPYMHDGRFATLDQVVAFYDSGIQPNPDLDQRLRGRNGNPQRLNLSAAERQSIVANLKTLTDAAVLDAAKFSNPFPAS